VHDKDAIDLDDVDMKSVDVSPEIQQFFDEVDEEKAKQDKMLEEILKGMIELEDIAKNIHIDIVASNTLIENITEDADNVNKKLKNSNQRLKEMLEETGGLSQWCARLICLVLLIALVGYLFQLLT